jgi:hypothetical protein
VHTGPGVLPEEREESEREIHMNIPKKKLCELEANSIQALGRSALQEVTNTQHE